MSKRSPVSTQPSNDIIINQKRSFSRNKSLITPDSKVHDANMGPTWDLSAPDGPHVGPMNLAIRDVLLSKHNRSCRLWTHHNSMVDLTSTVIRERRAAFSTEIFDNYPERLSMEDRKCWTHSEGIKSWIWILHPVYFLVFFCVHGPLKSRSTHGSW